MKSWTALIASTSFLVSLALAGPPEFVLPGADIERLAILLDLTDEQKIQMKTILEEQQAKMAEFNQPVPEGSVPGSGEVIKVGREVRQETLTRLQAVLTPEQLKKYEVLTEERVYLYRATRE